MADIGPRELLDLIRDLDADVVSGDEHTEYVEIMRWNRQGAGGQRDDAATTLVRSLLREKLGTFSVAEIGAATLAQIDEVVAGG